MNKWVSLSLFSLLLLSSPPPPLLLLSFHPLNQSFIAFGLYFRVAVWVVGGGKGEFLVKLESVSFYVFMCCYFKKTIKTNLEKKKKPYLQ